ncbi:unnamed protein product [Linum trigynum]|uniref:Uncharacterized protein n=1 Tax=Linum trigynum TaxID=586398 RepID=A0AAV2GDH5_9ROSI
MRNGQRSITNYKNLGRLCCADQSLAPQSPLSFLQFSQRLTRITPAIIRASWPPFASPAAVRVSQSTPRSNRRSCSLEIVRFPAVVRLSQPSLCNLWIACRNDQ